MQVMARNRTNKSEDNLIRKLETAGRKLRTRKSSVRLGIGDDAALFAPAAGREAILTCDWFLEGTHFLREKHLPEAVGWKCLARAVSDIAAMGGTPRCFLLSLALPDSCTGVWLDEFLAGLVRAGRKFGCSLAGGDTTRRRKILINVTVIGEVRAGRSALRSGARPGDLLFVSGHLGEAELGFRLLTERKGITAGNITDPLLRKHLYPEPRVALGHWLAGNRIASAMMDLSDGLSTDLPRLCAASGVGARVEAARVPAPRISDAQSAKHTEKNFDLVGLALNGGDDYELLFTVKRSKAGRLPRSFRGIPLTPIGEITRARNLLLVGPDGKEKALQGRGWDPFRK
jgi:thiamine-monophosphate kinase